MVRERGRAVAVAKSLEFMYTLKCNKAINGNFADKSKRRSTINKQEPVPHKHKMSGLLLLTYVSQRPIALAVLHDNIDYFYLTNSSNKLYP